MHVRLNDPQTPKHIMLLIKRLMIIFRTDKIQQNIVQIYRARNGFTCFLESNEPQI